MYRQTSAYWRRKKNYSKKIKVAFLLLSDFWNLSFDTAMVCRILYELFKLESSVPIIERLQDFINFAKQTENMLQTVEVRDIMDTQIP